MSQSLVDIAIETLAVVDRGHYTSPLGVTVDVKEAAAAAIRGTTLLRPRALARMHGEAPKHRGPMRISVTGETTAEAASRLSASEGGELVDVLALNFASAKNPGGGFLGGAKAQEEDLCRCSALYPCLIAQRDYYVENVACGTPLYTDYMIYSPKVPFFRDRELRFLERPFLTSVLTAPAPCLREYTGSAADVATTLERRVGLMLAAAEDHGHTTLVLGAWGCGAFRNDPVQVAETFHRALTSPRFSQSFSHVCFAVLDDPKKKNLDVFTRRFS